MWEIVRMWWIIHLHKRWSPLWKREESYKEMRRIFKDDEDYKKMSKGERDLAMRKIGAIYNTANFEESRSPKHNLVMTYVLCFWYGFWIHRRVKPGDVHKSHSFARLEENAKSAIKMACGEPYKLLIEEPHGGFPKLYLTPTGRKFGFFHMLGYMFLELEPFRQGLDKWGSTASTYKQLGIGAVLGTVGLFIIHLL